MSLNVKRVWLKTDDAEVLVPLSNITVGDRILVRMGSVIPLDGEVVEGEVMVNQASLTGESMPVAKRPGTQVYAGTVIEEGDCVIEVTQSSGESRHDKIVSMIEQSEQLKSAAESHAANLADKLVPYTLIGSALSYALTRNVTRALSVLMVDFSCALSWLCRWRSCPPCVRQACIISRSRAASSSRLSRRQIPLYLTRPAH